MSAPEDGSEALRLQLEPVLATLYANGQPLIDYIWPALMTYGREQRRQGAEQALRAAQMAADSEADAAKGSDRDAWLYLRSWIEDRADDLGRQT